MEVRLRHEMRAAAEDVAERHEELREKRDNDAVKRALARVTEAAKGTDNLMPTIIDAVKVYATIGEVSDAMRTEFGAFEPPIVI